MDISGGSYGTPMWAALAMGHLEVAHLLLEPEADVDAKYSDKSALVTASQNDNVEAMRLLLDFGADPNTRYSSGWTPLHGAATYEAMRVQLRRNANVNAEGFLDQTPLHYASENGHVKIVRPLIEYGANITARANSLGTPLRRALKNGKLEGVRLLLEHWADVNIPS